MLFREFAPNKKRGPVGCNAFSCAREVRALMPLSPQTGGALMELFARYEVLLSFAPFRIRPCKRSLIRTTNFV